MKLIFERGGKGQNCTILPKCDVPELSLETPARKKELYLPQVCENEISRHYTELAKQVYGINHGFYPSVPVR